MMNQGLKGKKIEKVMHEWGQGTLKSGGNTPVPKNRPDWAFAIAASEQRKANKNA